MKKKSRFWMLLYIFLLIGIGCITARFVIPENGRVWIERKIWVDWVNGGEPSENPVSEPPGDFDYYEIDPSTILADLKNGKDDIFHLLRNEPDRVSAPSGTYAWSQEEYLTIARAHHSYLTGEPVGSGWRIFGAGDFVISQCRDNMKGFDRARIIFYKEASDSFPVTYITIRPLTGFIESAYVDYKRHSISNNFYESDVMNWKISADAALQIAEAAAGSAARHKLLDEHCSVTVSFHDGNTWDVRYYWGSVSLVVYINAKDGSYKVLQR